MREFLLYLIFILFHASFDRFTSQQYSDGVKYVFVSSSRGLFDSMYVCRLCCFVSNDNVVSINGTEQRIKSMIVKSNAITSTANTKSNTSILWKTFNQIENNYWSLSDHSISSSLANQNIYSTHIFNQFIYRQSIVYRTQFSANFSFCAIYRKLQNGNMKDLTITANNLIQNNKNLILDQKNGCTNDHITDR